MPYAAFLDKYATPEQHRRWDVMHSKVSLTREQSALLSGFVRRMPVLVLNGAWCGDCINQCPIFDHFAAASTKIELRFLDREAREDARTALAINGGNRVPIVVFLSEDLSRLHATATAPRRATGNSHPSSSGHYARPGSCRPATTPRRRLSVNG